MIELVDKYVVNGKEYPNQLKEHLKTNISNLNEEYAMHPEIFAWYATAHELAESYSSELKEELKRLYAQLDHHTRMLAEQHNKKLTEKMVENTVITDPKYVFMMNRYLEACKQAGLLKAAKDAMIHKKDMLVGLGANYRAEGKSLY